MKPKIQYKDRQRFQKNPFINQLKATLIKTVKSEQFGTEQIIVNQSTGEFEGSPVLIRKRKVDANKFVKMYINTMTAWLSLSPKAQKILYLIIQNMKPNSDIVKIDPNSQDVKNSTGLNSKVSIYGGLDELIDRNIIAKARYVDQFYINPSVMFSGNRILFIEMLEKNGSERKMLSKDSDSSKLEEYEMD
jgi:hypothetical protein